MLEVEDGYRCCDCISSGRLKGLYTFEMLNRSHPPRVPIHFGVIPGILRSSESR